LPAEVIEAHISIKSQNSGPELFVLAEAYRIIPISLDFILKAIFNYPVFFLERRKLEFH
jgi:hypothetical protein